ncbi:hypothetical protein [Planctomycetes bacterium Pla163]
MRIRCIDATTGEAIEGAQLHRTDAPAFGGEALRDLRQPVASVVERGVAVEPAPDGSLWIERPYVRTWLAAVAPGHFGVLEIHVPTYEVEAVLEMVPRATIEVDVVDSMGAPVGGMPVRLDFTGLNDEGAQTWAGSLYLSTDADSGRASFELSQPWILAALRETGVVRARASMVSSEPVQIEFQADPLPTEPVVLTVPDFGSVVVEHRCERGELLPGAGIVDLARVGALGSAREWLLTGRAVFEFVEVDGRFTARTENSKVGAFDGPMVRGETIVVRVGRGEPRLVARIVDEFGAPLANVSVNMGAKRKQSSVTDEDGIAVLQMPDTGDLVDGFRTLTCFVLEDLGPRSVGRRGEGVFVLPTDFDRRVDTGTYHMGDVVLRAPPLLVHGRVVDPGDRGVAGVELAVRYWNGLYWADTDLRGWTDADGRFQIALPVETPEWLGTTDLVLAAISQIVSSATDLEFEVGDEVSMVVERRSRIEGVVRVSGTRATFPLRIQAIQTLDGDATPRLESARVVDDGSFEISLAAGIWSLQLVATVERGSWGGRTEEALALLDGLVVEAGERTRPPELDPWVVDLAPNTIQVQGPDGSLLVAGSAFLVRDGVSIGRAALANGVITIHDGDRALGLWIEAPGCAALFVPDASRLNRVALEAAPSLVVDVTFPDGSLPASAQLSARVRHDVPFEGRGLESGTVVEEGGARQLSFEQLPALGAAVLELTLRDSNEPAAWAPITIERRVDVLGGLEIQRVAVELTAAEIADALVERSGD